MILACFIYKITFKDGINHKNCCDNCIYNRKKARQVLIFAAYSIIAKLNMMYAHTT